MYRTLIVLLLCASAALTAPQQNSNITYVKRQLDTEYSKPETNLSERESRIEKVPLTIPSNVDKGPTNTTNKKIETTKTPQANSQPNYNYSDRIYSIKTKPKTNNSNTEKNNSQTEEDKVARNKNSDIVQVSKDSDIVPAESILNDRVATNDTELKAEIEATQSEEFVTESYEEDSTVTTEASEDTTKAPLPTHLPKLSYFEKSSTGSFSQNLITHPGRRRFRSRCRCEKIWNCAKLQISVPRCPEEYFMCCS